MVLDLGKALLRKEEYESARLTEFEFTEMVRALKALAAEREVPTEPLLGTLIDRGLDAAVASLVDGEAGLQRAWADYLRLRAIAREQLIAERGDPSPIRLG